jgi:ribosomal protein S6E (S10)
VDGVGEVYGGGVHDIVAVPPVAGLVPSHTIPLGTGDSDEPKNIVDAMSENATVTVHIPELQKALMAKSKFSTDASPVQPGPGNVEIGIVPAGLRFHKQFAKSGAGARVKLSLTTETSTLTFPMHPQSVTSEKMIVILRSEGGHPSPQAGPHGSHTVGTQSGQQPLPAFLKNPPAI